jgi:hypothetical protein
MRDLNNENPLKDGQILKDLRGRQLTADELKGDFKDATICVLSNRERHAINERFVKLRVLETKGILLTWNNLVTSPNLNELSSDVVSWLREKFSAQLQSKFLMGARVVLTSNINPVLGISNGTPGLLHSIIILSERNRNE